MAYLLLLPIALFFVSAAAILFLRRLRPGYGYAWLLAVLTVVGVWGLLLYFRFNPPPPVIITNWLPVTLVAGTIIFQLDTPAWVYTFALSGLSVAVILTASARLQYQSSPTTWAANLAITAAGMMATLASTPLTLVLAWTLIDLIELIYILGAAQEKEVSGEAVVAFLVRVTGTILLMSTMVLSKAGGQELLLIDPPSNLSMLLVIAAGLRLGVLPLHLAYRSGMPFRRGISTTLRMVAAASSLVLLGRLPAASVPPDWFPWLLVFAALAGLYGATAWVFSPNEIQGRPFWMISLASLAVVSVIRSYPQSSLAWGTVMILSGASIFLYSARELRLLFLSGLGALALSGLPFTPGAAGWQGLSVFPINLPDFWFWLVHVLLLLGYLRHMNRPEETLATMERWIKAVYPVGLFILMVTAWIVAFWGWPGEFGLERWFASLPSVVVAGLAWFGLRWLLPWWANHPERTGWVTTVAGPVGNVLNNLLRLTWLYRLGGWLYFVAQRLVRSFTIILEGEGGMLWVLVLLALLISLLQNSGGSTP